MSMLRRISAMDVLSRAVSCGRRKRKERYGRTQLTPMDFIRSMSACIMLTSSQNIPNGKNGLPSMETRPDSSKETAPSGGVAVVYWNGYSATATIFIVALSPSRNLTFVTPSGSRPNMK